MAEPVVQKVSAKCPDCRRVTNHIVKAKYVFKETHEFDENNFIDMDHEYRIMQCAGCNRVSFQDLIPWDEGYHVFQYPTPVEAELEGKFLEEDDLCDLPNEIRDLYLEVKKALQHETNLLAGIGLRTLVEAVCLNQSIAGHNLQEKIKGLRTAGWVSDQELPIIDKLRLIGNVSTHEIIALESEMLVHSLQIINHMLKSVYILPAVATKINFKKKRKPTKK